MSQAVVLLNMGGPSSVFEVDLFLKNMFNDPHILPIKNPFLRAIVASIIVHRRSNLAKENYKKIGGKSPIVTHAFNLTQTLQELDPSRFYTYAMRYAPPMTEMTVRELIQKEIKEVILFSLYPHYSTTTTLSSIREFYKQCHAMQFTPKIIEIDRYYTDLNYNKAIIMRILETLNGDDPSQFTLIFSAHALPKKMVANGDPYECEIRENIDIIRDLLVQEGIHFKAIDHAYQSRIGPVQWLEPSLDKVLKKYKNEKIIIYPISFTLDNSETDFELHIEYRKQAQQAGIGEYRVVACLNDSLIFAKAILHLITQRELHEC